MAALGFFFVVLPAAGLAGLCCFAACRQQRHLVFKVAAYAFLTLGSVFLLTPLALIVYFAWMW